MTARIAFVTMVRDEPVFLPLWIAHYSRISPRDHMFVVIDGLDQALPQQLEGLQVLRLPQVPVEPGWDAARWRMLTAFANALLERFDVVVLNDVDELIVLDPRHGDDLLAALAEAKEIGVISPFAVEVVHRPDLEHGPLRLDLPILRQRRHVRINSSYAKPCITARAIRWSLGGHASDYPDLHLSRKLYLFHLRAMDRDMMLARQARRRQLVSDAQGDLVPGVAGPSWHMAAHEVDAYYARYLARGAPEDTDFDFEWQRLRVEQDWTRDPATGLWSHARVLNRRSYRVPDRFADLIQPAATSGFAA